MKLGTHVDCEQMYCVYRNQAVSEYLSLYFSFSFLSSFQTLKFFVTLSRGIVRPRKFKLVTHMENGWMCRVYRNHAAAHIRPFIFSFFFLSNFQTLNFLSHFFQKLLGLEDWNLVHTRTVGRCIVYTEIRLLLSIRLFIHCFSLQFSNIKIFRHTFLRNCEA